MRIGVLSDTHGHTGLTQAAASTLAQLQVEQILHCGDIGSPSIFPLLEQWPGHFVAGNVDGSGAGLDAAARQCGHTFHGRLADITLAGRRIAIIHGDDSTALRQAIDSGEYDLVCTGHTHQASLTQQGSTVVLNPGAVYRANPHTVAVVDLTDLSVEHLPIEPAS